MLRMASATRVVPLVCVFAVITTLPPKPRTARAISSSHVATKKSEMLSDSSARRRTCSIIGRPWIGNRILRGNRSEARCAGITATIFNDEPILTSAAHRNPR